MQVTGCEFTGANPEDFLIGSSTCGKALTPGTNCRVTVRFAPQAAGARAATLQIADTAPGADGPGAEIV